MKKGLNKMDIAKYHKWLKQEVPLAKIAKALHTTVDVLKGLTPGKMKEIKNKQQEAVRKMQEHKQANRMKADILVETAAQVMAGGPVDPGVPATAMPAIGAAPDTPGTLKSAGTPTGQIAPK